MSFTIQHPVSGLSWATNDDGKIILSSTSASVYTIDDAGHIQNINTELCVRNLGPEFFETEHYGAMPEFDWAIEADGTISNSFYGLQWVGEDLTVSATPFAWKKVLPTRASSLIAAASVAPAPAPAPAPVDPATI
jgi:hypothetical protein